MVKSRPPRLVARVDPVRLLVAVAVIASTVAYAVWVPPAILTHIDHYVFVRALDRMRHGQSYYPAMRDALQSMHIVAGRADAFRFPLLFEVLRWIPGSMLHLCFYAFVVVGASLLVLRLSSEPIAALLVAVYLLVAGQSPAVGGSIRDWMLVELWAVPVIAGALLAHRRRHWWLAALLVGVAVLIREINAPLLLGGVLYAHRRDLPRKPWMVVLGACGAAFAVHLAVAANYVRPHGTDAALFGSASPTSVFNMLTYRSSIPIALGLLLWGLAWRRVVKLGIVDFAGPLLAIPLLGLVVDRPYWGFLMMPFVVMWSTEALAEVVRGRLGERTGTADAGSSRLAHTREPAPRTPAAEPALPSAR
jgi:hypothetical protein